VDLRLATTAYHKDLSELWCLAVRWNYISNPVAKTSFDGEYIGPDRAILFLLESCTERCERDTVVICSDQSLEILRS
jgi:hypothetical protein